MADLENHRWPAVAKINRFLHIVGRREDGYHELQTVFQFIDLADELNIRLRQDDRIDLHGHTGSWPVEQDLVFRAARLLQQQCHYPGGADIHIHKQIPAGGGLGGGSSDAATTLVALNRLWGLGLSAQALSGIGRNLGADVPVFVQGQAAWAEGAGEKLTPLELDCPWCLLVMPDVHMSTAEIFSAVELTRNTAPIKIADFEQGGCYEFGHNDCESVVIQRSPEIARVLNVLRELTQNTDAAQSVKMSGTGSSVFALFNDRASACTIQDSLPEGWRSRVIKTLNRSPLLERLQRES
ncbi:MAG TPA: 4-(cytidine 5'-diphospho)-2-C-methyl-D-erythritol kinase [Gammaproteobacteria bacterium]|nr:4-(cytidine 5'-diphospho)-2-C-methyl-D-erythritol kinase [Gammaproteobacteria bacterium]